MLKGFGPDSMESAQGRACASRPVVNPAGIFEIMQYVLTEQELEALKGNPQKALNDLIQTHKKEIREKLTVYLPVPIRILKRYVPANEMHLVEREMQDAVYDIANVFAPIYR